MPDLQISNLHVTADEKNILKGLDLSVSLGEVHALMGPNGSGKSTLANAIMGHPALEVTDGEISLKDFRRETEAAMELVDIPREFSSRYVNDGFSGGEKKRLEVLQMALLRPRMAILDETDSGLDIDALRVVAEGVNRFSGPDMGILIITHYQRILHLVEPDFVHVMYDGRIVKQGGPELVGELEDKGYGWIKEEVAARA